MKHLHVWVGALFSIVATKERPCHVYSNPMRLNQIIGLTMMYNGATSDFEVKD